MWTANELNKWRRNIAARVENLLTIAKHLPNRTDSTRVIVDTPDFHHCPMVLTALKHHKHVYSQKPLVQQLDELRLDEERLSRATRLRHAVRESTVLHSRPHESGGNSPHESTRETGGSLCLDGWRRARLLLRRSLGGISRGKTGARLSELGSLAGDRSTTKCLTARISLHAAGAHSGKPEADNSRIGGATCWTSLFRVRPAFT
jgi:hypothetical protein